MVEMTLEDAELRIAELKLLLPCCRGDAYRDVMREYGGLKLKVNAFKKAFKKAPDVVK